jgi:hypothetical protein
VATFVSLFLSWDETCVFSHAHSPSATPEHFGSFSWEIVITSNTMSFCFGRRLSISVANAFNFEKNI